MKGVLAAASVSKSACFWISFRNASAAGQSNNSRVALQLPVIASPVDIVSGRLSLLQLLPHLGRLKGLRKQNTGGCGSSGIV